MKRRLRRIPFLKDDQAQALTEFVIVIPVILLMFFSALQTMVIAQASQLVNYAAFTAARCYATSHGKFVKEGSSNPHQDAEDRAKKAATLVMAPVSHAQFGEALFLFNPIRDVFAGLPEIVDRMYALAEGYLIAYVYRIKNFEVTPPTPAADNPQSTIRCTFDYMLPLSIPGLAEMWNYLYIKFGFDIGTFEQHFELGAPFADSAELSSALNEAQGALVDISVFFSQLGSFIPGLGGMASTFQNLNLAINNLRTGIYTGMPILGAVSNIRLPGEATMGFEPWVLVRVAGGYDEATEGESEYDECLDRMRDQQEQVEQQQETTDEACDEAQDAEAVKNQRQAELNACQANPPSGGCSSQQSAFNSANSDYLAKREVCEDEGETLGDMNDELANFSCP